MKLVDYCFRIISLPIIITILLISLVKHVIEYSVRWIKYGGELNVYDKNTRTSIQDIFNKMVQADENTNNRTKE